MRITNEGRLLFAVPSPYVTHAPIDGRPARIEPVFIWQTEPTWFNPSAQQERNIVISSTCSATVGYRSETHMPLWPYCFHLRVAGISVFDAVPIAVITLPKDAGIGCPARRSSSGLGSKMSMWLGPPSMNSQITDFAVGAWSGFFGASGSGGSAACSNEEMARAPNPPQDPPPSGPDASFRYRRP